MSRAGFDKYITVFSPEGSLYQVEYAFKAVTYAGLLTVAIRCKDAVLVFTQHSVPDKLMRPETITSLYNVNDNTGVCITGRAPDGKALVQKARNEASEYKYRYGMPMPVSVLAKRVADMAQVRTQQAGMRLMGTIMTFVGMEQNDEDGAWIPQIYCVDPAGWCGSYHACAVGKKQIEACAFLEKKQKNAPFHTLSQKEAAMIALAALQSALGESLRASGVEVGRCTADDHHFSRVPDREVEEWLTLLAEAD
ncbi:proteasome alpha 1 subunit, putative [Trypanosoma equiperdum]|uniref:Proteasome subunit alpha type n=4 Tax=Trypanozoon TaxID=39700 RepID=Q38E30_TRYB2|nr:20S proteasome subunit alpha-6, putative [Trypanosoma brucei gambiense DAL972]XP_827270.1 proteasome subunit alpha 1 [Trypanosoma brucei brucei TREU927]RHW70141.1 proteasome alpha 1 subunit [Trypanosoma brucei equiperdum]SCU72476.1 proteasome alpha 1 subunit, putative [Trypanosoma equiperdum]EAN76940.1 proteasome alpha 1 subunit, putative [Trypanosoma brucei brucei TREU927]CBH14477.1 20S proteasome subunit alpha-6, putative [Trypanosoma brucei gambiense DAL972]|eukprot:XP_011776743.1 20S proteasome subunit alpha-6, putative [Trypanosoma brucei gambiense DAL972]